MKKAISLHPKDNVATLLANVNPGEEVQVLLGEATSNLIAGENLPFGHKLALKDIRRGENIIKYGEVIGQASRDIAVGAHVHFHNVESLRGRGDLE